MATRDTQASLAAAYQFMASYLVWDLRDLLKEGSLRNGAARERLGQFIEMLKASGRAAQPVYPATQAERSATGNARAERTRRLVSLSRDEQLFDLLLAARGDANLEDASAWAQHAREVLESVVERGWVKPDEEGQQRFIHEDIEDFLRRLQRVDQLDEYRPARRSNLKRR
jgi:hypothetical protein